MSKIPILKAFEKDTWVKPYLQRYKAPLMLAIFLGFCTFFSAGALMFNSGYLISKSASLPENILLVYVPIVLTRAFGVSRPVFRYIERLTSHNWVLKMTSKLRRKLYHTLEKDAMVFKQKYRMGDILGLLAEDIQYIQNLYLRTIFPLIIALILYAFIVIAVGVFSIFFALYLALLLFILVIVLPVWSVVVNGARQEREKTLKTELYTDLTDNVLGVADWIFSQRGSEYVDTHLQVEQELYQVQDQKRLFNRRVQVLFQLIYSFVVIGLIVWTSQRFVGNHGGAANWIAAFVLSAFPVVDAFVVLPEAMQESNVYKDSINRLNALDETPDEAPKNIEVTDTRIQVEDLSFSYDHHLVLDRLDLTIEPGEKIAILGKSGSGKSTLASLIRGDLKPQNGLLTLGGVPTYQFGDAMSHYISVIQQAPYLFHTTILNNVRMANMNKSEEEVWQVLERVGLKKLVEQLPEGLHTMVDEAGLRFSGGERHRMALARILLQDTPIVLLDEPTVGLDPLTEQALIDTFFSQLQDKTVIWITHHLQGIEIMDRVIFIEDGRLEMSGTPADLAQNNARFQQLKAIDEGKVVQRLG
ncbi:thiol reductant ABC exporter subunit CydC [Enterococcus cecorum]|uniref:Thiol reductant ABC exporter, CydC subunit n=1 Tax=Enterococcus cecorum DSM 20682 = ATCC 43198 TaxID=1121864 RepID=S1QZT6_9ENTE|nr:thiol reductant ABC exporter subunit CydC [Enterococcus cecorum]EOX18453.1 thiol reductant ABC exporter, CydC subunit [Enterococcus cecorum DSM 20682 = ATCC 43198]ESK60935.1 thiol reductant ABC exporter, CydC subunit [Enterococcus cecorum DSM 20682 = ATCC 43198]KLO74389.1 cysteine ABC transporter ATP-binding protein [Enterococcus cecorum]MDZ5546554.1 thiol reductant ABC exporter subunit CydC [Enterococcus cecorum]MDZ5581981.1 thiol reductant ABC exporter subunit CydC [Enterococcus cecorum]